MKKPTLGRGKNMSIPKAAIVWFFEKWVDGDREDAPTSWDIGDYGFSHEIVEIAGAKQCSFFTSALVAKELARSNLWNKRRVWGMYGGLRGGIVNPNIFTPSEEGRRWFDEVYKGLPPL